jgi:thiol:disulfide interchange protein DsbD
LWAWPKSGGLEFESWSEATQQKYLDAGKIVVVDFSARWCVTCQTNEAAVRADRGLKDFLGQRNAALLKADWTNSDPEITKALAGYGRASVPVWVALKGSEKIILPELVSGSDVRKAVQQLAVER